MIDKFLNKKQWDEGTTKLFINKLYSVSAEKKCEYVYKVSGELINRRDPLSLKFAKEILEYAREHFLDSSSSSCQALIYYRLGNLYEIYDEDFNSAYECYEKYTLLNDKFEGNHSLLLKALILRDNFTYSDELEKELRLSYGEFDLGTKNDRLYEALGKYIVADYNNDEELKEKLKVTLKGIVDYDKLFLLDIIFKKDSYPDTLMVPKKVIEFVTAL